MLYSMTGFGRSENRIGERVYLVEIKSLNGKQFDLRLNMPSSLKPYEFEIRNLLNEGLNRGTVECIISVKQNGAAKPVSINTDLIKSYYVSIAGVADELGLDKTELLSSILKLPEVVATSNDIVPEEEWSDVKKILVDAIAQINAHRKNEGAVLEKDLLARIVHIESQAPVIAGHAEERKAKIKENLEKLLAQFVGADKYDSNRLEQELIYYIEKIDIHEEQVRLQNHCNYFKAMLAEDGILKGKKLSFILQEIGREINTTGSKAYNTEIQKAVVTMKDELEKAKEQVLNAL